MKKIDWNLLRKQKRSLLKAINNDTSGGKDDLVGLLHLIDHLQDNAVETGEATEVQVFGRTDLSMASLEHLMESFIESQDNTHQEEWFTTDHKLAMEVMNRFKHFLAEKEYAV